MTGVGARHLRVLAQRPRPAGSDAERLARAQTLTSLGFDVRVEPFTYSAFPGRYGTPIGGALLATSLLVSATLALSARDRLAALTLGTGVAGTVLFARWLLGDGVLPVPWMRRAGENLAATRGSEPAVWLVAHLDSKSQPVPSAMRVAGVLLLAVALVLALLAISLTLVGGAPRTLWWVIALSTLIGAAPVLASVVGDRSDGAVDNASGVAAVLAAAALLRPHASCGVLLSSAEELGLAGARAWAREHAPATALNCDGVDDEGELTIMYNRYAPPALITALTDAAPRAIRVRRMPFGLLTDSTAFDGAGWHAVTVSHGSLRTLRRVHTPADSLHRLRGTAIDDVATLLARAAEALAP